MWRHRHDTPCQRVVEQIQSVVSLLLQHLLVHGLGRNVHHREIVGSLARADVPLGNGLDVPTDVGAKVAPAVTLLVRVALAGRGPHAPEVFERELGVHRNQPISDPQHGVHAFPAGEFVLQGEVGAGQDLPQQLAQQKLSDSATDLG